MGTPLLDRINDRNFQIEPDPERPGCWQVRDLSSDRIIAVGLHRDTAIQHVWMLEDKPERRPVWLRRMDEQGLPPKDQTSTIKGAA